ncbi:unnamed protein product, partial [marine sediment metagenome]
TLCGVKRGTYNTWCQNPDFVALYRRRDEFEGEYKQEAIQLLRRDNQLAAVLLESKILAKMKEEILSGELSLTRTNLAKEVYSKLINDLDYQPPIKNLTFEQRVLNLETEEPIKELSAGGVIEGEFTEVRVEDTSTQGQ